MNIHLNVVATLSRLTQNQFIDATVRAKTSCLVSRLLRANISMNAKLEKTGHQNRATTLGQGSADAVKHG